MLTNTLLLKLISKIHLVLQLKGIFNGSKRQLNLLIGDHNQQVQEEDLVDQLLEAQVALLLMMRSKDIIHGIGDLDLMDLKELTQGLHLQG